MGSISPETTMKMSMHNFANEYNSANSKSYSNLYQH